MSLPADAGRLQSGITNKISTKSVRLIMYTYKSYKYIIIYRLIVVSTIISHKYVYIYMCIYIISPQNMAKRMVLTYLHFRILKIPLAEPVMGRRNGTGLVLSCHHVTEISMGFFRKKREILPERSCSLFLSDFTCPSF